MQTETFSPRVVVGAYVAAWNTGDTEALDLLLAEGYVDHTPDAPCGRECAKRALAATRVAYPDYRLDVEDVVVDGDRVVVRSRVSGTHPGGEPFDLPQIQIERVVDGRIVEHWRLTGAPPAKLV